MVLKMIMMVLFKFVNTECGIGACAKSGNIQCVDGVIEDTCIPGTPVGNDNKCDGIDCNCNSMTDEGYSGDNYLLSCVCTSTDEWICHPCGNEVNMCTPGISSGSTETGNELCDGINNDLW